MLSKNMMDNESLLAKTRDPLTSPLKMIRKSFAWAGVSIDIGLSVAPNTAAALALSWLLYILNRRYLRMCIIACIVLFFVWHRCPTILSRATFWGEDGWVWYPTCYANGLKCLLIDHTSYLQTISMLTAWMSQVVSFANAPKFFATCALLIQASPAIFLLSSRMAEALPSFAIRILLAALLIAIPGMREVYVNTTNSQWHLSLLAFLILCSATPHDSAERLFDSLVLFVGGLSGPFSIFLAPSAILWWFYNRDRWNFWRAFIVVGTALIQISLVILHQSTRSDGAHLGASIYTFTIILLTKIIGVATFGANRIILDGWDFGQGWLSDGRPWSVAISISLTILALAVALAVFLRGSLIIKTFLLFVGLELVATLVDGLALPNMTIWHSFEIGIAYRYAFHPICAWLVIVVACAVSQIKLARWIGRILLVCSIFLAIPADWTLFPLSLDTYRAFHHDAKLFIHAKPGTVMSLPVRPVNVPMTITKR